MVKIAVFNKGDIVYALGSAIKFQVVDGNYFDEAVLCLKPLDVLYLDLAGWYLMRDCRHV